MRRARFFASLTCILPRRFRRNGELKLPRILGFLGCRGVGAMEMLAGFGKSAEMGFGEGLWPAEGSRGYFGLLYASRTHGSSGGGGLGGRVGAGVGGCLICAPPPGAPE